MKYEAEIKDLLIENTIHLIASVGFEKATTKEIAYCGGHLPDFKMNEVYIYRFFNSKERLYEAAFLRLGGELADAFKRGYDAVGGFEVYEKEKLQKIFEMVWLFIMGNEERCRCYVRYYYSSYFKDDTIVEHKRLFEGTVRLMTPIFKEDAHVEAIMNCTFSAIFGFAIRVHNGDLEDSDENRWHIFNVLYCMVATYLKDPTAAPRELINDA